MQTPGEQLHSRKDAACFGIGFGAKTAEAVGLVENLYDTTLLGKRREGKLYRR